MSSDGCTVAVPMLAAAASSSESLVMLTAASSTALPLAIADVRPLATNVTELKWTLHGTDDSVMPINSGNKCSERCSKDDEDALRN